jgi:myosin heavy subunit
VSLTCLSLYIFEKVGSQFKGQLNDLLVKINATRPHFVRCIKPNDRNEATSWHGRRVLNQVID